MDPKLTFLLVAMAGGAMGLTCPGPGVFCASCDAISLCTAEGEDGMDIPCQTDHVCGGSGMYMSCFTPDSSEAEGCACEGAGGYLVDKFDPTKYYLCLPDGSIPLTCAADTAFDEDALECVEVTTTIPTTLTPCNTVGEITEIDCTSYSVCLPDNVLTTFMCEEGTIFNVDTAACVDPDTIRPEPFTCTGKTDGLHGDTVDCSTFYVCVGGNQMGQPLMCAPPPNDLFSGTACGTDNSTCPVVNECALPTTTTQVPA